MANPDQALQEQADVPASPAEKPVGESTPTVQNEARGADGDGDGDGEKKGPDAGSDSEKSEEKIIVGMVCDTKNLYQKWDRHDKFTWTEEYPDDLQEAAENEETMKYAILVRNKKSYDSRKKLEIDSIVIQSPHLKKVLHEVLKGYPGVTTTLQRLTFSAPFRPFVHRWTELTAALENQEHEEETRSHVKLLWDVLHAELRDVISALTDYIKNKVITYEHVWTIFQPGCTVLASRLGRPVAVRLDQGNYTEHPKLGPCFMLKCDRVDWDGAKFGYDGTQQVVMPFLGTVAIDELECCPLQFHPDPDAARASLVARGRIFESLAGYHYKSYKGQAIEQKQWGPATVTVESRIVIDAYAHGKWNPDRQHSLKALNRVEAGRQAVQLDSDDGDMMDDDDNYSDWDYRHGSEAGMEDMLMAAAGGGDGNAHPVPLTEEQLVLCTPMVRGYALKSKKWLEFFVDCVDEVAFNDRAFESLVLPAGHKSLVLAFAQSQVKFKDRVADDVIAGKGKGIIMLLSGGPGIGKTLTAESVAETMRVPLYVLSADDLGQSSWEFESNIGRVLEMVAKWNAVLLIDECDVFLERRTSDHLDRNRMVAVFLRTLEYYEGILFLTTNRVGNMDEAFHSRIHISLEYPPLDREARRQVWVGFLGRAAATAKEAEEGGLAGHTVSQAEVEKLARLELNGRQIKNVLKTSNLLAFHQGQKLGYVHLRTVLRVEGREVEE